MALNVGINVLETDGKAAPSIQAAATSVGAFLIRSERGVPNAPRRVSSPGQFRDLFGGFSDGAFGAFAVQGFFDNGGATAYVVRVVDAPTPSEEETGTPVTGKAWAARLMLQDGSTDVLAVKAGYRGALDHGAWGNNLKVKVAARAIPDDGSTIDAYDLIVQYKGVIVETWEKLKIDSPAGGPTRRADAVINDPLTGSKYITVTVPDGVTADPDVLDFTALADGDDDELSGGTLDTALTNALHQFDALDVQLVSCVETTEPDVVKAGMNYCETRGDCVFIAATTQGVDVDGATSYGVGLQRNKRYGAVYYPWIQVLDPRGGRLWMPATGHVMGVYARIDQQRGIWKAPAGNEAGVMGSIATETAISDADHTHLVKDGSVNAIRFIPGQGIVVDSSRTPSTNTLWLYVNVRLLFNMVKTSLKYGLRWVVQEPNTEELWKKVKVNTVTPFLMNLWKRGAFGPGAAEDVFTVKCDADNNPPANIQQGIFTVEVYFYPSRPAETVVIIVGQQEGAGSAQEA